VVDDDLEVALGVLLVAEGVPASASRVTHTPSTRVWTRGDALDLRDRRVRAREVVLAHAGTCAALVLYWAAVPIAR
jgi:hypothetical protein